MDYSVVILDEMLGAGGNVSGSVSAYESPATRKPSVQDFINRRYGCDRKSNHHARARCVLQGRIDQLKLQAGMTADPKQRLKILFRIAKWKRKLTDEIGKNRYRKPDQEGLL